MVRAKVRYLRAAQAGAADGAKARAEAEDYVALAGRLAGAVAPALVVMNGPSGTGKTTISQRLLEKLPAVRIRTDVERKRLHGYAPDAATGSAVDSAIYGADATRRTYDHLTAHAEAIAGAGYTALLDGTFLRRRQRDRVRELAARLDVPFVIAAVEVPEAVLRRRVVARASEGRDASEATPAVLERQLAQREPLAAEERAHAVVLDGTLAPDGPRFAAFLDEIAAARAKSASP
jgi:predicted kinase